jgi:hypothetical protein
VADFNIKGQVEVDDKGSLKKVEKQAGKTAKSFDRLEKSQNAYNRREKGVAQITSNSTKAFAKQAQTVRVGIVPAYAVLAANVFALTAAFNALRRAAQVEDLARGLQFVGNVAGRDLKSAAERIREVTGAAVSMGEAMRTTAVGISAGFRTDQLEGLAKVAKGASIALGRDMGDALDRLTRGVAKLEPEILDELGILVRLDEAAQKYADQLGVSVESLTRFQRQQAFLNETLTQGEKKYGDIADQLNPNAYDQLAAAVANLANSFLNFFNDTLKLSSFMNILANNTVGLAGVAGVLGASLTRQIAPAMFESAQRARLATDAFKENSKAMLGNVRTAGALPKVYLNTAKALKEGDLSAKNFSAAYTSLDKSLEVHNNQLVGYQKAVDEAGGKDEKANAALARKKQVIAEVSAERANLVKVEKGGLDVVKNSIKASNSELASQGRLITAFRGLNEQIAVSEEKTKRYQKAQGKTATGFTFIGKQARFAAGGIRLVGIAFLSFLPYIGLIISAVTILGGILKEKFFPKDVVEERLKKAEESLENIRNISAQFAASSSKGTERTNRAYIILAGVLEDLRSSLASVLELNAEEEQQSIRNIKLKLAELKIARDLARAKGAPEPPQMSFMGGNLLEGWKETGNALIGFFTGATTDAAAQTAQKLDSEIEAYEKGLRDLEKTAGQATQGSAARLVKKTIEEIQISRESGGLFSVVGAKEERQLNELLAKIESMDSSLLSEDGTISSVRLLNEIDKIRASSRQVRDDFAQVDEQILAVNSSLGKFRTRATTPLDTLVSQINELDAAAARFQKTLKESKIPAGEGEAVVEFWQDLGIAEANLKEFQKKLKGLGFAERFRKDLATTRETFARIRALREELLTISRDEIRIQNVNATLSKKVQNGSTEYEKALSSNINDRIQLRKIEVDIELRQKQLTEKQLETDKDLLDLIEQRDAIKSRMFTQEELNTKNQIQRLNIELKQLEIDRSKLAVSQARARIELQIQNTKKGLLSSSLTEGQIARLAFEDAKEKLAVEEAIFNTRSNIVDKTYDLEIAAVQQLLFYARLLGEEGKLQAERLEARLASLLEERDIELQLLNIARSQAEVEKERAELGLRRGTEQAQAGLIGSVRDATGDDFFKTGPQEIAAAAATAQENLKNSLKSYTAEFSRINNEANMRVALGVISQEQANEIVSAAADRLAFEKMGAKIAAAYEQSKPFFDQLRSLGPEGQLAAAIGEGGRSHRRRKNRSSGEYYNFYSFYTESVLRR